MCKLLLHSKFCLKVSADLFFLPSSELSSAAGKFIYIYIYAYAYVGWVSAKTLDTSLVYNKSSCKGFCKKYNLGGSASFPFQSSQ